MNSIFSVKYRREQYVTKGSANVRFGTLVNGTRSEGAAFGRWNWTGKRLVAEVDRYGAFPLFYSIRKGWVGVSDSLLELLREGVSSRLDYAGLSVFLRLGFFIGEDTPFQHIKVLPPGGKLVWEEGKATVTGGYPEWMPAQNMSLKQASDAYFELFRDAISRIDVLRRRAFLPLSGGVDSRHILLEMLSQGKIPNGLVTSDHYPSRSGEDIRIASMLARAARLPITLLSRSDVWFDSEYRKNLAVHFLADEHAWTLRLAEYLEEQADVIFDGLGGDAMGGTRFLTGERHRQLREERFEDFIGDISLFGEPAMKMLLSRRMYRKMNHRVAVGRLTEELRRHVDAPSPVDSFFFWNRTRREIALVPTCIYRNIGLVEMPFMDDKLADFRMSISGESLLEMKDSYRKVAITRGYPEFARIPFENKKAPSRNPQQHFATFSRRLARYCLGRKTRLMNSCKLKPRLMRSLLDSDYAGHTGWFTPMALYLKQLEESAP